MVAAFSLSDCRSRLDAVRQAAQRLAGRPALAPLTPLAEREWYRLIEQKLLPQLQDDSYLVAAVVGGTNIGKSAVFNRLARDNISAVSPLASGTKHPVCLLPPGFEQRHDLADIFKSFNVVPLRQVDEPLAPADEHFLYWRTGANLPRNLILLDTPDIDSDAEINWERAHAIRRSADLLIAVLTQQKYNDAAVKEFFRLAARESKAVLVVFNQCALPDDEPYWPRWLETFCRETSVAPLGVYLAPYDRRLVERGELPFYWRPSDGTALPEDGGRAEAPVDLTEELARLRFDEIKLAALRGALQSLLDEQTGIPAWLAEIGRLSQRFQGAIRQLADEPLEERWPAVSGGEIVREVRRWWHRQRHGWERTVHALYGRIAQGVRWPLRQATRLWQSDRTVPPAAAYRQAEWEALQRLVETIYRRIDGLLELDDAFLTERLRPLATGDVRQRLLDDLKQAHEECDLERELTQCVEEVMSRFQTENPRLYRSLKWLDKAAAAVRPAFSISLFVVGFGPAGDAAVQALGETAVQGAVHVAGEVAGGAAAAVVGDQAIDAAGTGVGYLEVKLRQLQEAFCRRRRSWAQETIDRLLWGDLKAELEAGRDVMQSHDLVMIRQVVAELERLTRGAPADEPADDDRSMSPSGEDA